MLRFILFAVLVLLGLGANKQSARAKVLGR